MEFDIKELQKQRRKELIESGEFARIEIVVGENDNMPYIQSEICKVTLPTIMGILISMDSLKKEIIKKFPLASAYSSLLEAGDIVEINLDKTKKEE